MAKKMKKGKVICLLLLLVLIAIAAPVSAITLNVTLNKTYQFQDAYLLNINDQWTLAILRIHRSEFSRRQEMVLTFRQFRCRRSPILNVTLRH